MEEKEIKIVQGLIEKCLQLYMNQAEVCTALELQAGVPSEFTTMGNESIMFHQLLNSLGKTRRTKYKLLYSLRS
jgi:uncharacterized protein (TIGR01589 family)